MQSKHKFIDEFLGHYFELLQKYDFLDYSITKSTITKDQATKGIEPIEIILEDYCVNKFHILYGYYTLFDAEQNKIVNIHKQPERKDKYVPIPTSFDTNAFSSIVDDISQKENGIFWNLPDAYRSNNWMFGEDNFLHNIYAHTYTQKLNKEAAYNIVLSEEVIFFLFGKLFLESKPLKKIIETLHLDENYDNTSQVTPNLKQLLKFALSVESKLEGNELSKELQIQKFLKNNPTYQWNESTEYFIRRQVEIEVDQRLIKGKVYDFITKIAPLVQKIICSLLTKIREIYSSNSKLSSSLFDDVELWQKIARFNFRLSESILEKQRKAKKTFHDVLLFPMLKSNVGNFKTNTFFYEKCITNSEQVDITVPFVMTCYITTLYGFDDSLLDEDEESLRGLNITMEVCKNFAKPLVDEEFYQKLIYSKLKPAAIKSAISQVMARNASHNIASHVINKLINADKLKNLDIKKFHRSTDLNNYLTEIELEKESEIFHQLAIFNNYVKCRMDYLSDVTFGTPLMQTTKKLNDELFKDLDRVRLLLEYISGLSHFQYKIQFTYDDKPIDNNLSVALPNDILGCQAFYNIVENIIRNTAKHAKIKPSTTIFTINFCNIDTNEVPDNMKSAASNYYKVEIFDNVNITNNLDLIENQNKKINESILNPDTNTLRASSLGLIEMEASACYLRKLDISSIEDDSFNLSDNEEIYSKSGEFNIIKAFPKKGKKDEKHLAYRFFMLRPAEVLIVTDVEIDKTEYEKWEIQGVKIITVKEFKDTITTKDGGVFNHQFLVYDDSAIKNTITDYATSLPIRQLLYKNVKTLLQSNTFKDLELILWQEWEKVLKDAYEYKDLHIGNSTSNDSTKINAVLLDHLGNDSKEKSESDSKDEWARSANDRNIFYLDAMSSKAQQKLPEFGGSLKDYFGDKLDKNEGVHNETNLVKLSESIFCKILVIDERIQEATKEKYMGILFEDLYKKTNIIVPSKEAIDLSAKDFDKGLLEKLKTYIEGEIKTIHHDLDFLLVHYSILERMWGSNMKEINKYLEDIFAKQINVVVTSGRGTPEGLSPKVRFVNLSPVITSFVEIRSKYLTSTLLHSTRKSNRL